MWQYLEYLNMFPVPKSAFVALKNFHIHTRRINTLKQRTMGKQHGTYYVKLDALKRLQMPPVLSYQCEKHFSHSIKWDRNAQRSHQESKWWKYLWLYTEQKMELYFKPMYFKLHVHTANVLLWYLVRSVGLRGLCGSQRTMLGIIPEGPSTIVFDARSLSGLQLTK